MERERRRARLEPAPILFMFLIFLVPALLLLSILLQVSSYLRQPMIAAVPRPTTENPAQAAAQPDDVARSSQNVTLPIKPIQEQTPTIASKPATQDQDAIAVEAHTSQWDEEPSEGDPHRQSNHTARPQKIATPAAVVHEPSENGSELSSHQDTWNYDPETKISLGLAPLEFPRPKANSPDPSVVPAWFLSSDSNAGPSSAPTAQASVPVPAMTPPAILPARINDPGPPPASPLQSTPFRTPSPSVTDMARFAKAINLLNASTGTSQAGRSAAPPAGNPPGVASPTRVEETAANNNAVPTTFPSLLDDPPVSTRLEAVSALQPAAASKATADSDLKWANCATCGGIGSLSPGAPCASCGGRGFCAPGQGPCYPIEAHTTLGRFFADLYECLCCPDPCYQPAWVPEANASFLLDYARPKTITRIRFDYMGDMQNPDMSEYWWPEARLDKSGKFVGKGPKIPSPRTPGRHSPLGWSSMNMGIGSIYFEAAAKRASFFVEVPFRSLEAFAIAPANQKLYGDLHSAGFADMNLGTKSLLLDCELMQLSFQFRTYLPTGNLSTGLGNGHVSLEPSLLTSIKLAPQTYLQAQLAEWVPIGGDQSFEGSILKYGFSFNQVLYQPNPNLSVIGTMESFFYSFQDGIYSNAFGPRKASGLTYANLGPGLRVSICNRIDCGLALTWQASGGSWGDPWLRTELRILY